MTINKRYSHSKNNQPTPTRDTWKNMVSRCTNLKDPSYSDYGGRGITVCVEWLNLSAFITDMGLRPIGLRLDRIDNNKGYYKENCRWVTPAQSSQNKRNVLLTARKVLLIRALLRALKPGTSLMYAYSLLGPMFGVSPRHVGNIWRGHRWIS